MKKILLFSAVLAAFSFNALADTPLNPGAFPNWKPDDSYKNERQLKSFTLQNVSGNEFDDGVYNVDQQNNIAVSIYKDLTGSSDLFITSAGATVGFKEIKWAGSWMHGYLYIDCNKDGGFNSYLHSANYPAYAPSEFEMLRAPEGTVGDLMAFSAKNVGTYSEVWYNSRGETAENNSGVTPSSMGTFTIPDLAPGTYQALFKIDWDNLDQHGASDIGSNAGCAVHFNILVADPAGFADIELTESSATRYYNLQGIEVAEPTAGNLYIVRENNTVKKVIMK